MRQLIAAAAVAMVLLTGVLNVGASTPKPVAGWIRNHATVLGTTDPAAPLDDLAPLGPGATRAGLVRAPLWPDRPGPVRPGPADARAAAGPTLAAFFRHYPWLSRPRPRLVHGRRHPGAVVRVIVHRQELTPAQPA